MQERILLYFTASWNQLVCFGSLGPVAFTCAVASVCDQQGRRADVVADLAGVPGKQKGRRFASVTACGLVYNPPLLRDMIPRIISCRPSSLGPRSDSSLRARFHGCTPST